MIYADKKYRLPSDDLDDGLKNSHQTDRLSDKPILYDKMGLFAREWSVFLHPFLAEGMFFVPSRKGGEENAEN